jgi:hypothetical protein
MPTMRLPDHIQPEHVTPTPDKQCQLRRSTQHLPGVYSQGSRTLRSFSVVDSGAARPGRAAPGNRRTGRCPGGSIVAAAAREGLVLGHLQSAIPRQRASQSGGKLTNVPAQCRNDNFRVFARHLDQHGKARMTFYQSHNVAVLCTAHQIAFPMARNRAVFHFRGPFADGDGIDDLTP